MHRLLVVCLAFVVSGCAGLTIQKDRIAPMKKAAIIGFQGHLNLDDGSSNNIVGAIKSSNDMFSGKMNERREGQAAAEYSDLARKLGTQFTWEVLDSAALANSPTYQVAATGRISPRTGSQYIRGVLNQPEANRFDPAALSAIARELGVDALVTVDIRFDIGKRGGFSMGGMGKVTKYPVASTHFKMFDAAGNLVWEDWNARGLVTQTGLATTMGAEIVENESEVLTEAAGTSFDALLAHYRDAK